MYTTDLYTDSLLSVQVLGPMLAMDKINIVERLACLLYNCVVMDTVVMDTVIMDTVVMALLAQFGLSKRFTCHL